MSAPELPLGPRPWRTLLAMVSPPDDREAILDDLSEDYLDRLERAPATADSWYRRQVIASLPSLLARRLQLGARRLTLSPPRKLAMSDLLSDLRGGWRGLRRAPVLSVLVIVVLALGIGANTAIFGLLNPILLRPLPYANAERLVHMFETDPSFDSFGWDMLRQSLPTLEAWSEAESFEEVAGYYYAQTALRSEDQPAGAVTTGFVTANLLPMLGVEPMIGRNFTPGEDTPGRNNVLLLSHSLWQGRFGGDAEILGREVLLDGLPHSVVGVMDPSFSFPYAEVRMWKPAGFTPERWEPDDAGILTLGRLAPGVTFEAARTELAAMRAAVAERHPEANGDRGVRVVELRRALVFFYDILRAMMLALLFAGGFMLLIVCANVANLLLSRTGQRRREVAIRSAMGAGRGRIARQLLTENALLAVIAGVAGIAVARAATGVVGTVIPAQLYRVGEVGVDGAAVAFTAVITLSTAIAFGVAPALSAARISVTEALKESHAITGGKSKRRLTRALVFGQVSLATFLCGGAFLAAGAAAEFGDIDVGFDPADVLTVELTLPAADYPTGEQVRAFYQQVTDDISALPGVSSVGWIGALPLDFSSSVASYRLPGTAVDEAAPDRRAAFAVIAPGYLSSMRIPLHQGRDFDDRDSAAGQPAVIVNEMLASRLWPDSTPNGQTLIADFGAGEVEATVVGVAGDSIGGLALNGMEEQIFAARAQRTLRRGFFTVRSSLDPAEVSAAVRATLSRLDPDQPVDNVRTMNEVAAQAAQPLVAVRNVLSGIGVFALILAALGVYGVAARAVAQRTHEIGVRMALGAGRTDIVRIVMRSAGFSVLVGTLLGTAGIVALQVGLAAAIDDPSAVQPLGAVGVGACLAVVASIASWLPARRATRIDPLDALRESGEG